MLTVWASPAPPYSLEGADGPSGFEVDVVSEVARRLGLEARILPATGDPLTALEEGFADVSVAGARISVELEARVNLSQPYLRVVQGLVVNADVRPDLKGLGDLVQGDDVAVVEGSTGHAWAAATLEPEAFDLRPYPDAEGAVEALTAGDIDAALIDEAEGVAAVRVRPVLRMAETVPTGAGLGIAVDPRNDALLHAINEALLAMTADGTYDMVYDRYQRALPPSGRITAG